MEAETGQDRQALLAELTRAREKLDAFVHELRAIDRELEDLAPERKQHRLLQDACGALDELAQLGGAGLFWGADTFTSTELIRRAQGRVDAFEKRVGEIEENREAVLEALEQQQGVTDGIEDDVLEAMEEEERRQQEWILTREIDEVPARALIMPWTRGGEEDRRYRRSLALSVLYSLLFALVAPQIPLPVRELVSEPIDVPERVVRLMMQARPLPPPPPPAVARPEPRQVPEEAPLLAEAPAKPKEGPGKGPGEGPGQGPAKGLLAFREKLAQFATNQPLARLGSQARISSSAPASGPVERAMVTSLAPGSSGGINLAALSRGVSAGGSGGGHMAGVQVARVASAIGGAGTGTAGGGSDGTGTGDGPMLGRTDEEIQIVFDRYKSALYRLYNRELRNDPTLKGQVVLRMRIEPDGSVSLCELQGTDMRAPQLVAQVLDRVRTFDFGAKEGIAAVTILYPIDFLPAT